MIFRFQPLIFSFFFISRNFSQLLSLINESTSPTLVHNIITFWVVSYTWEAWEPVTGSQHQYVQVLYAFAVDRLLKAILSCLSRSVLGGNGVQKNVMPTPCIPHVKIDGIGLPKNRGFLSNQPILPYPTNTPILWKQKQTFTLNLSNLKSTFISLGVEIPKNSGKQTKKSSKSVIPPVPTFHKIRPKSLGHGA